mmetsp:Transcript_9833/g.26686  ORF Transcript_9833/g.26686 Transcript_9833/m.26686 type:complete len:240 (-) Transcript_9833:29-748(-)
MTSLRDMPPAPSSPPASCSRLSRRSSSKRWRMSSMARYCSDRLLEAPPPETDGAFLRTMALAFGIGCAPAICFAMALLKRSFIVRSRSSRFSSCFSMSLKRKSSDTVTCSVAGLSQPPQRKSSCRRTSRPSCASSMPLISSAVSKRAKSEKPRQTAMASSAFSRCRTGSSGSSTMSTLWVPGAASCCQSSSCRLSWASSWIFARTSATEGMTTPSTCRAVVSATRGRPDFVAQLIQPSC